MNSYLALLFTILIELFIFFTFQKFIAYWRSGNQKHILTIATFIGVNFISHPLAWQVFQFSHLLIGYWPAFAAVELCVFIFEAESIRYTLGGSRKECYSISFFTNAASAGIGLLFALT